MGITFRFQPSDDIQQMDDEHQCNEHPQFKIQCGSYCGKYHVNEWIEATNEHGVRMRYHGTHHTIESAYDQITALVGGAA